MRSIYVCRGSDCRQQKVRRKDLAPYAGDLPISVVGCQKICKSPVVGVDLGDGPRWFKRFDSKAAWTALADYIRTGKPSKELKERESKKRAGRLRD